MDSDQMIDTLVSMIEKSDHDFRQKVKEYRELGVGMWAIDPLYAMTARYECFQYFCGTTALRVTDGGRVAIEEYKLFLRKPTQAAKLTLDTKTLPPTELYTLWKTEELTVKYRQENDREERYVMHYLKGDLGIIRVNLDAQGQIIDCYGY